MTPGSRAGTRAVVFAETAQRITRVHAPGQPPGETATVRRGMCVETHSGPGELRHVFADGTSLLDSAVTRLSPEAARAARAALAVAPPGVPKSAEEALRRGADDGTRLTWARSWQRVAVGSPDQLRTDTRSLCSVEASVLGGDGGALASAAVPWDAARPRSSAERLAETVAALRRRAALPVGELPGRACPVVLDAGQAGAFFHELVGHPLEADIVLARSSYLARRRGEMVAPPWFGVVDGAGTAVGAIGGQWDDEGSRVRPSRMIDAGRVGEPLSDIASAALLGGRSSGHGRRLDYRHCVLPRMRHTVAAAQAASATPVLPDGLRLHPRGLQLRWMNLLTGDFEFAVTDALLVADDAPVCRTGPLRLAGNGLRVLAGLRPGGGQPIACGARATRGCGKLDQFPLPVSFANSTLWLPAEVLRVDAV
ncbi:metallopeptidase TldD-related protein [Streptomyces litchfieldiae]|uniref:Metallopeptidase TldD-related protein n=1 Tax=Streptomyces litchfieldiae TaxID=3075543 RepID=A0ABU2MPQ9_9ACTN|nr:metallopeptidase TldD-related protein [Streptomyces sp. DSM 44938]MDT0343608.1 metallopeptidase TldD-related protein [Streptomyces sp. DSM 44938]